MHFSEVNTRVGIDFTDTTSGHFLEAGRIRNWTPQRLVPARASERLTQLGSPYDVTTNMISWRRDGGNFVVNVTGPDRERIGSGLRNFLSVRNCVPYYIILW